MLNSLHILNQCIRTHRSDPPAFPPPLSLPQQLCESPASEDVYINGRPDTPLVASKVEPLESSGRGRSDLLVCGGGLWSAGGKSEMELLSESTADFRQRLVCAEDE